MKNLVRVLKALPSASKSRRYILNLSNTVSLYLLEEGYGTLCVELYSDTGLLGDGWYSIADYSTLSSFNLNTLPDDISYEDIEEYVEDSIAVESYSYESISEMELSDIPYSSFPSKSVYIDISGKVYSEDRYKTKCVTPTYANHRRTGSWYNSSVLNAASKVFVGSSGLRMELKKCRAVYEGTHTLDPVPALIAERDSYEAVPIQVRPSKAYEVFRALLEDDSVECGIDGKKYSKLKGGVVLDVEEASKFFRSLKKVTEILDCFYYPAVSLLEVRHGIWSYFTTTWNESLPITETTNERTANSSS